MKILVVNGVNINMTGKREPMYGEQTLDSINAELKELAIRLGAEIEFYQSNIEGEIVNRLQKNDYDGLVINAGAYTHYSIAIADALSCVKATKVEVHMTNILAREEMRQKSVIAPTCDGVIAGFGKHSYALAIRYIVDKNEDK